MKDIEKYLCIKIIFYDIAMIKVYLYIEYNVIMWMVFAVKRQGMLLIVRYHIIYKSNINV